MSPLKSFSGVTRNWSPSISTFAFSPASALYVRESPSTSVAESDNRKYLSSTIDFDPIESSTGGSFTGTTWILKLDSSVSWPSETAIET